ncbi:hypothetical protein BVRB_5g106080 [Beta vulgaris subsp. vulgaris]|nr:hypothetical protein BVRB_5g106080 [Beta vulgaris subsp. vulgaris]
MSVWQTKRKGRGVVKWANTSEARRWRVLAWRRKGGKSNPEKFLGYLLGFL